MLERSKFREVVINTPLVAIDLVVRNKRGEVLLGLRKNGPAKDTWFVPGGRILKDEKISAAFARITGSELGTPVDINTARFIGVYEHLHEGNFADEPGFGTHYVVLAHELTNFIAVSLPRTQHSGYRWLRESELLGDPAVHPYTKDYFR
ncbi:MAG TPA: GDP-mannose mannosyl hydrolase [Candidatus Binatia bacterium]|jgi:colanic acid biosynthesis protein WcaH